jgi:hypothetical protein
MVCRCVPISRCDLAHDDAPMIYTMSMQPAPDGAGGDLNSRSPDGLHRLTRDRGRARAFLFTPAHLPIRGSDD